MDTEKGKYNEIIFADEIFPMHIVLNKHVYPGFDPDLEFPHWHDMFEIKYYKKGHSVVEIDGKRYSVAAGDVVFINPFEGHLTVTDETDAEYDMIIGNSKFISTKIDIDDSADLFRRFATGNIKITNLIRGNRHVSGALDILFSELHRGAQRLTVVSLLLYLYSVLFAEEISVVSDNALSEIMERRQKIENAIEYIARNYDKECNEEALASMCGLDRFYFSKLFKKVMGVNVHTYIDDLKLFKAQTLLSSTSKNVCEIAYGIGFKDESYFYRWYKKKTGLTPGEFRQSLK